MRRNCSVRVLHPLFNPHSFCLIGSRELQVVVPQFIPDRPITPPFSPPEFTNMPPSEGIVPPSIPEPTSGMQTQPARNQEDLNTAPASAPGIQETEPSSSRRLCTEECSKRATAKLMAGVLPGLYVIRDGILQLVKSHEMTLKETRETAFAELHLANDRLEEERKRLHFVEKKVRETAASDISVTKEYEKAREVLTEALTDQSAPSNLDEKISRNKYLKNCESLVKAWTRNVEIARERVAEWEFKSTRQIARVGKLTDTAHAADVNCRKTCAMIDKDIEHLADLAEFLQQTKK